MIAEIISIGDELTSGQRLDTNSQWVSQRLGELGIVVMYHTTVADDLTANQMVFEQAIARADIVVATGGLGPTADDLTRDALAAATGVDLVLDEPSLAHIRALFARFSREMPERNILQATFPRGSRPIFNPSGTAPGIEITAARAAGGVCHVFALPGVPAEMHEMFEQSVAPALERLGTTRQVIQHRRLKCFGAGESHIEEMLPDLIRRGRKPSVGITVHEATITLRVTAEGSTAAECAAAMEPTLNEIRHSLGHLVFGEEDDELEHAVVRQLRASGQTLATIEVATEGLMAHWLSQATNAEREALNGESTQTPLSPGEGRVRATYIGGLVSSDVQAAQSLLGLANAADEPSGRFVEVLAAHAREKFGAHFGLAIGAFPRLSKGSSAGASQETVPQYFYALATTNESIVKSSTLASHPSIWKPRAAKLALNLLRLHLIEQGDS